MTWSVKMGLFDRQIILYEGKDKRTFKNCQDILRQHQIKFKSFSTDDQIGCGCCGLNGACASVKPSLTYSIFVKEKDAGQARELTSTAAQP
jgi:hypothetical protein